MRKFWIVLIALGLIAAFSMPASAADVKFSGSYYVQGWYSHNNSLLDQDDTSTLSGRGAASLFHQRLRVQTEFKVAEGLFLTTRFDALERNWGDRRERNNNNQYPYVTPSTVGTVETASRRADHTYTAVPATATTPAVTGFYNTQEQANIEFERAYITANLPFGQLNVGYYQDIQWGTLWLDTITTRPAIGLAVPVGPWTFVAKWKKNLEGSMNGYNDIGYINDSDADIYDVAVRYGAKGWEAGVLFEYGDSRANKVSDAAAYPSFATSIYAALPYFKATFGPLYLEGEAAYYFGTQKEYDGSAGNKCAGGTRCEDVDWEGWSAYLHAKYDLKPMYFGAMIVYSTGDDPNTKDKVEGGINAALVAGQAFTPALILWNDPYYTVFGAPGARTRTNLSDPSRLQFMDNCLFVQGYVGVKPTPKWDIALKAAWAKADEKPAGYVDDVYGTEIDLVATYKIFDNLSYMVGAAYLFTGDYFKGAVDTTNLENQYMLMHQLTLTF